MAHSPNHNRTPPDPRLQALALASTVGTVVCFVYAPLYYWLGSPHVALACLLAVPLFAGAPVIQRIWKHPAAGLEVIHFTAYALITCVTYLQGGLASSPTLWWLVSIPVVALTAGGHRSAAIWLVTILATVCAFYWVHWAGLSLPADLGKAPLALVAINAVSLFVVILVFLALVERARYRALEDQKALNENLRDAAASLESQNAQLAVARDEALAASKAKSQFLANMSHEIRTPMNGVLGMAQLLATTAMSSDQQRFVKMLTASGEHLLTVINDILDISKLEAGKIELEDEDFSPRELAESVTELLALRALGKGLEIYCLVSPEMPETMRGDAHRMRQILSNLMSNAIRFTERGEVGVAVSVQDGATPGERHVQFAVRDTGIGIEPHHRARLFQPFTQADGSTTRQYGGTGLGLAIARQLARLMEGDIEVMSGPGHGSVFTLSVPLRATQPTTGESGSAPRGLPVLRCEPQPNSHLALQAILDTLHLSHVTLPGPLRHEDLERLNPAEAAALVVSHGALDASVRLEDLKARCPLPVVVCVPIDQLDTSASLTRLGIAQANKPLRLSHLKEALREAAAGKLTRLPSGASASRRIGLRILLAEDNDVNVEVALAMLEIFGCHVEVAHDGIAAVKAWSNSEFDLVLMDCMMPGMDGYRATREIRLLESISGRGPTPIIAVTGNAMPEDKARCFEAGMTDYMSKPFSLEQLEGVLKNIAQLIGAPASPPSRAPANAHSP